MVSKIKKGKKKKELQLKGMWFKAALTNIEQKKPITV